MGIFERNETGICVPTEEWRQFTSHFPFLSALYYVNDQKTAYFDDNVFRILQITKENASGSVNRQRFMHLIQDITRNPIAGHPDVYQYHIGHACRYLRFVLIDRANGDWLGFLQDVTMGAAEEYTARAADYDPLTQLLTREAFLRFAAQRLGAADNAVTAAVHVHGISRLAHSLGYQNADCCLIAIGKIMQKLYSPQTLVGVKSAKEFYIQWTDVDPDFARGQLDILSEDIAHCQIIDDFGERLTIPETAHLSASIGYCTYPTPADSLQLLTNYASYALFRAQSTRAILPFSSTEYAMDKEKFQQQQLFFRLIEENLFVYHYQPIVHAKTGAIIGYEALMRTHTITLTPLQILELAAQSGSLYAIERATLFNTLEILSQNQDVFANRKLFVNCIPSNLLSDVDFNRLHATYGELVEKLVTEMTEQTVSSEDTVKRLKDRVQRGNCEFAMDDYGTGYSNTSSLLRYMPNYVKIDISMIRGIGDDLKKQRLVRDIVGFCHENQITVLAEGVETSVEMQMVISLGVDLLQGYYLSRPKPFFAHSISQRVITEIETAAQAYQNAQKDADSL